MNKSWNGKLVNDKQGKLVTNIVLGDEGRANPDWLIIMCTMDLPSEHWVEALMVQDKKKPQMQREVATMSD